MHRFKRFLETHPSIELLWINFLYMPQQHQGPPRIPDEQAYPKKKLIVILPTLFLAVTVMAEGQGITDNVLAKNGRFVVKQRLGPEGTLLVDQIQINTDTMVVQVRGNLMKELTDGRIVAKIALSQPPKGSNQLQSGQWLCL